MRLIVLAASSLLISASAAASGSVVLPARVATASGAVVDARVVGDWQGDTWVGLTADGGSVVFRPGWWDDTEGHGSHVVSGGTATRGDGWSGTYDMACDLDAAGVAGCGITLYGDHAEEAWHIPVRVARGADFYAIADGV